MFKNYYNRKIWMLIGLVVNLSQMIEYNLSNILALNEILVSFDNSESMYSFEYAELLKRSEEWYEKLSKQELGKIINNLKNKSIFNDSFIKLIDEIRNERNYYVHTIFKNDLFTKKIQMEPKRCIVDIKELVNKMGDLNNVLVKEFDRMKTEVKMIY